MSSSEEEEKSRVSEEEGDSEEAESEMLSEPESENESIKEGMTGNLKEIFETKDVYKVKGQASLFTKNRAEQVNSSNLEDDKIAKAEAIF